jgi:mannosyl-oligosaccharide alpha-1,2-mannosidase
MRRWRSLAILAILIVFSLHYFKSSAGRLVLDGPLGSFRSPSPTPIRHWSKIPERYPVTSKIALPIGKPTSIPKIQASPKSEDAAAKKERLRRQRAVKGSFIHSWNGYKNEAWMMDEVVPVSGGGKDTFGGWAATLVDSLDTLWIMGMKEEFEKAVKASAQIDFTTTKDDQINVFETTIRYLGGFLAAYDLSGAKYPLLLKKAMEIGDMLMSCFDTPNRMPRTRWDWKS